MDVCCVLFTVKFENKQRQLNLGHRNENCVSPSWQRAIIPWQDKKRGCHHSVSGTITEGQHCHGGATLSLGKLLGVGHSPSIFSRTELFSLFILCNNFFFCCSGLSVHACVGLFQPLHSAGKGHAHVSVCWGWGGGEVREVTNLKELYLTGGCLHWHWIPHYIYILYSHSLTQSFQKGWNRKAELEKHGSIDLNYSMLSKIIAGHSSILYIFVTTDS